MQKKFVNIDVGFLPRSRYSRNAKHCQVNYKFSRRITGRTFNSFWLNKQNSSCLKGTFEAKKLNIRQSVELCNQTKINYFCIVDRNVKFHLIGFDEEDPLFYPVPNSIGDLSENYTLYESERLTIGKLVGRHLWYKPSNYDLPKELTFSSCNYNEFTCSNGECINSQYVCQYEGECSDSSDEAFSICEVGIPPNPFYDATAPPSPHSTNISIQFELIRMADINMETSMMTLYFLFTLGWRDERLGFKFLKPNASVVVSKEIAEKYWHPEVLITEAADAEEAILSFEGSSINKNMFESPNIIYCYMEVNRNFESFCLYFVTCSAVTEYKYALTFFGRYYPGKDVEIRVELPVNISIKCDMNFFFYPFDDQLNIQLSKIEF
ncbi:hypothetical protein Avbf_14512 [Armadillidium vulgare]|nr:hypothetical protein Avbf_14512 [Armadillidium vulgare]